MVRRITRARALTMVAVVLAAAAPAAPAFAQGKPAPPTTKTGKPKPLAASLSPEAKADYETGKVLFTDGDFAGALIKFQAAYDKVNDPRLLWNIAACEKNLRHYAKALRLITRYTKEGDALLTPDDVREAKELAGVLEPLTTQVTFHVAEAGADVFIDDEKVGTTPLAEALLVDVGMRHFRVVKAGFRPYDTSMPIGGAKTATVDVKLEPEGGRLKVGAPPQATVTVDDKVIGQGPQDVALTVGGHVLRVTAPNMRTFQTEVTIQDNQARTLDVALEAEGAGTGGPELRVAVGCDDPRPRSPEEGLSVYLDGSANAALARGVQKSWREDAQGAVVDYVSYPISAGTHTVHVRFPGCEGAETRVEVVPNKPAEVKGVLRPEGNFFSRGPAGYPDWWRVSAGMWVTTTHFDKFYELLLRQSAGTNNGDRAVTFGSAKGDVTAAGPALSIGLVGRWLTFLLDLRYASGSTTGSTNGIYTPIGSEARAVIGPIDGTATISTYYAGFRFGAKVPLQYASIAAGPGVAFAIQDISSASYGHHAEPSGHLSGWAALDVQPICDGFVQAMVQRAAVAEAGSPTGATSFVFSVGYQPNQRCRRDQGGLYRIEGSTR